MKSKNWDILIIDGDGDFRSALSALLSEAGYAVRQARTCAAGLSEIHRDPPSLVMCALSSPELSGFELLKILRARPQSERIPVAVISRFGFGWEAAFVGAEGSVEKPLQPAAVLALVERLLQEPERRLFH